MEVPMKISYEDVKKMIESIKPAESRREQFRKFY
jgi:hypothetical protein